MTRYYENVNPNVAKEFQKYWHAKLEKYEKMAHLQDVEIGAEQRVNMGRGWGVGIWETF